MKQALIYIGMLLLAISCGQNRDRLHTGDLLFQAGKNTEMTGAITAATGEEGPLNFSHVGIAVTGNGADSVLEATTDGGVRLTLLEEFLGRSAKIGGRPAVVAMRLKDHGRHRGCRPPCAQLPRSPPTIIRSGPEGRNSIAANWCGKATAPKTAPAFHGAADEFRAADGTLPQFWADLFDQLGEQVPEGLPGTNPNDMAREELLEEVHRYF